MTTPTLDAIDLAIKEACDSQGIPFTKVPSLPKATREPMPVIWKCLVAGCTTRVRESEALVLTEWRRTRASILNGGKTRVYTKMRPIGVIPRCPEHDRRLKGTPIVGVFDESIQCGPKCTKAIGASCRCTCGGANHGTAVAL